MHGTRADRCLFLFEQILLIAKRKESGYSCKATLMVSKAESFIEHYCTE